MRSTFRILLPAAFCLLFVGADSPQPPVNKKAALAKLQEYVGSWRGAGQLRRGSTKGAWTEQADWAWKFSDDGPALVLASPEGKYVRSAALHAADDEQYQLVARLADGESATYSGKRDEDGRLVLLADKKHQDALARISIRLVADGKRLVVLYEGAADAGGRFVRLAEVGYTRKGSRFGQGASYIECVVTGGVGTIAVEHAGKTYYVCCSGCRDYFNENPDEVLAEYRQRKEAENQPPKE